MEKWSRTIFFVVELILGIFTMTMAVRISADEGPQKKVAVIVEDSGNSKWNSYIKGLKDAAKANNLHLVICNTDNGLDLEEEKELMEEQRNKGVNGFILQPAVGKETESVLSGFHEPILLNASTTGRNFYGRYALVAPDNYRMGAALGQCIVKDYNGNLRDKSIGVVRGRKEDPAVEQRWKGLSDVVEKAGGKICWILDQRQDTAIAEEIRSRSTVSALAVLETDTLEDVADAAAARDVHGAIVYGIGHSIKSVYALEREIIAGLVTADLYDMGYYSVQEMAQKLSFPGRELKDRSIDVLVPDKGELFTEKYQKFLSAMER